jgi:ribosome biogenesis GTPase
MTGLLVKGVGGLYTVYADGRYYFAKPRGKFRKDMLVPVIGDRVELLPAQGGEDFGAIERIFPRKNCFVRPRSQYRPSFGGNRRVFSSAGFNAYR